MQSTIRILQESLRENLTLPTHSETLKKDDSVSELSFILCSYHKTNTLYILQMLVNFINKPELKIYRNLPIFQQSQIKVLKFILWSKDTSLIVYFAFQRLLLKRKSFPFE